jgi:hypothetical protein
MGIMVMSNTGHLLIYVSRVSLNKLHQSPIGFCENPQLTRLCVNYPLPNFSHEKLVFFRKLKSGSKPRQLWNGKKFHETILSFV